MKIENKMSNKSFDRELKRVEIWKNAKKKEIKKRERNFIDLLGKLCKESAALQNYQLNIDDIENSRFGKSSASNLINESIDSVNINKQDILETQFAKQAITGLDISSLNVSIINSARKNNSKIGKTFHKGRDNNMSIDSSRCVKATLGKDKHMYSIIPFEYKIKSQNITSPIKSEVIFSPNQVEENQKEEKKECVLDTESEEKLSIIEKENKDEVNISNNSIQILKEEVIQSKNTNKEIVYELTQEASNEYQNPLITPRNNIETKGKECKPKDSSFESPNKSEKEDWDLKLPSIKSSSGHENLRQSQFEHQQDEVKEHHNNSLSVELLDKSAEVEVYISPKDLSPRNSGKNSEMSHLRTRINSLRIHDEVKTPEENEKLNTKINSINENITEKEEIKEDPLASSTKIQNDNQLLKLFEQMKEPMMSAREVLQQKLQTEDIKKTKTPIEIKQMEENAIKLSSSLFDFIFQDIMENMFTARVNVELLRNKDKQEIIESENKQEVDKSETEEENSQEDDCSQEDESDSDSSNYSALKLQTNSCHVMDYVNEILKEVQDNHIKDVRRKLTKPIRMNDLSLLKELQFAEYEVERTQEYETESIIDIQLYLQKERRNKIDK